MNRLGWAANEVELFINENVPEMNGGDKNEMTTHEISKFCSKSALKLYQCLYKDSPTISTMNITETILDDLIHGYPLVAIKDNDDAWESMDQDRTGVINYQCKRRSSLVKRKYPDGTIEYVDNECVRVMDLDNTGVIYTDNLVRDIYYKMFPIQMPYFPPRQREIFVCDTCLAESVSGKTFDEYRAILYMMPNSENKLSECVLIDRYFALIDNEYIEVTYEKYLDVLEADQYRDKYYKALIRSKIEKIHTDKLLADKSTELKYKTISKFQEAVPDIQQRVVQSKKTLDDIKTEFTQKHMVQSWNGSNEQSFIDFIKKLISDGLILTDAEIYYLLNFFGLNNVNMDDIRDRKLATSYVKIIEFGDEHWKSNTCNLFMTEVFMVLDELNMDKKIIYIDYRIPFNEDEIRNIVETNKDSVVVTQASIPDDDFPSNRYYHASLGFVPKSKRENKSNAPDKEIIELLSDSLSLLGFESLRDLYPFLRNIPFVYPNDKGKAVIDCIRKFDME